MARRVRIRVLVPQGKREAGRVWLLVKHGKETGHSLGYLGKILEERTRSMFQHELSPRGTVWVARSPEPPPILAPFSITSAHTHSLPPSASHAPVVPLQRPQQAKQHRQNNTVLHSSQHSGAKVPFWQAGLIHRSKQNPEQDQVATTTFFFLIPQRTKAQTKTSQSWRRLFYCRTASFCYHLLCNDPQQHQTWRSNNSRGSSCSQGQCCTLRGPAHPQQAHQGPVKAFLCHDADAS